MTQVVEPQEIDVFFTQIALIIILVLEKIKFWLDYADCISVKKNCVFASLREELDLWIGDFWAPGEMKFLQHYAA